MNDIFVGPKGLTLVLNCYANISASTVRKIKYRKPSGVVGEWTAVLYSATEIAFTTSLTTSEIDAAGDWVFQAYVETPNWKLDGDKVTLHIQTPVK